MMEIIIEKEKLTNYLLKHRERNDKSKFLNSLGFNLDNWENLKKEIIRIYEENHIRPVF